MYDIRPCWILCSGRTGSSYLVQLINIILGAGWPEGFGEKYNKRHTKAFMQNIRQGKYPKFNKMHREQFERVFIDEDKQKIEKSHPDMHYILLKRKDLVAQTVSWYFCRKTDIWFIKKRTELNSYLKRRIPFDGEFILQLYEEMSHYSDGWTKYLEGSEYFPIYYEELSDVSKLSSLLRFMDLPCEEGLVINAISKIEFVRMKRPETDEYCERLRELIKKAGSKSQPSD